MLYADIRYTVRSMQDTSEHRAGNYEGIPEDAVSLVRWNLSEEKVPYSRDKKLLIVLIGFGGAVLAIFANSFIFAVLLVIASVVFVLLGKRESQTLTFAITDIGFFLDDDFLPLDEVHSFNIIDVPGARAQLLLRSQKIIYINEIVPIYDVDIEKIQQTLKQLNIPEDETLEPDVFDWIASFV